MHHILQAVYSAGLRLKHTLHITTEALYIHLKWNKCIRWTYKNVNFHTIVLDTSRASYKLWSNATLANLIFNESQFNTVKFYLLEKNYYFILVQDLNCIKTFCDSISSNKDMPFYNITYFKISSFSVFLANTRSAHLFWSFIRSCVKSL